MIAKLKCKFKRSLLILLSSLILFTSVFTSYSNSLQVQAAGAVYTTVVELLQYLLASSGIIVSTSQIKDANLNSNLFDGLKDTASLTADIYKWIFSLDPTSETDRQEFLKVMTVLKTREASVLAEVVSKYSWINSTLNNLTVLDKVSYKTTGTRVSGKIIDDIINLFNKYKSSGSSALKDAVKESATILSFPTPPDDNDDNDPLFGKGINKFNFLYSMIGTLGLAALNYDWNSTSSLVPKTSSFTEYDSVFNGELTFDESIRPDNEGFYNYSLTEEVFSSRVLNIRSKSPLVMTRSEGYKLFLYVESGTIGEIYIKDFFSSVYEKKTILTNYYNISNTSGNFASNIPIFESLAAIKEYFSTKNKDLILNINKYFDFITNVPVMPASDSLFNKDFSREDLGTISSKLDELLASGVGKPETVPNIDQIVNEVISKLPPAPNPDPIPEPEPLPKPDPVPDSKADIIGSFLDGVIKLEIPILSDIVAWMKNIYNAIFSMTVPIIQTIPNTLKQIVGWTSTIPEILTSVLADPFKWLQTSWTSFITLIAPIIEVVPNALEFIVGWADNLPLVLSGIINDPFKWFQTVWNELMSLLSSITAPLIEIFPNQLEQIIGWAAAWPDALADLLASPFSFLQVSWGNLMNLLNDFKTMVSTRLEGLLDKLTDLAGNNPNDPDNPTDEEEPNDGDRNAIKSLFNILILLIFILMMILRIFVSVLGFIVAIFNIPASPGFLHPDMIKALDYLKTLEIAGMGISVYGFMQALLYIILMFSILRVLRHNINGVKIPKAK